MSTTIIRNAKVYIERGRFEEALLIEDGFVRKVGTNAEVEAAAPADAKVYDAKGRRIGHSAPGLFGGMTHYDSKGRKVGDTTPGIFGGSRTHLDEE